MHIVCARCGTPPTDRRHGSPWCGRCERWLVHDAVTGQWISFAEYAGRQWRHQRRQAVAATRDAVLAACPAVEALLPAGWRARLGEPVHGGSSTLELYPPADLFDGYGYLVAPICGHAWRVRVYHRSTGVCRSVFIPATATPVTFAQAADAVPVLLAAVAQGSAADRPDRAAP